MKELDGAVTDHEIDKLLSVLLMSDSEYMDMIGSLDFDEDELSDLLMSDSEIEEFLEDLKDLELEDFDIPISL